MLEDFDAFLNTKEFAVGVRSESPDRTFTAIFDNEGVAATLGGMDLETTAPQMEAKAADVADFVRGETLVYVDGIDEPFTFLRARPDGTGWATVELAP